MKTDRNKNNLKSEENMIWKRAEGQMQMFFGRKQGKRENYKSEKKTGKRCDLENSSAARKWLSMGIVFAVAGAVVTALIRR